MSINSGKNLRVLITGARGFVGGAIVSELSKSQFKLILLNRNKSNREKASNFKREKASNFKKEFIVDITSEKDFEKLSEIGEVDVLIHSAGLAHQFGNVSEQDFESVNVSGTKNVLKLAKTLAVKHFILISSVSVYGVTLKRSESFRAVTEESDCHPEGFYAISKLKAEQECMSFCKNFDLQLTILRLATVVGEFDRGNFYRLIRSIDRGRFVWVGKGENRKSIVYKSDVGRACRELILSKKKYSFQIYNISTEPITVNKIVKVISEGLGKNVWKFSIPPKYLKQFLEITQKVYKFEIISKLLETIEKWLAEDVYSGLKFKKAFDFEYKTSPEEAIRKEVSWYRKQKGIK